MALDVAIENDGGATFLRLLLTWLAVDLDGEPQLRFTPGDGSAQERLCLAWVNYYLFGQNPPHGPPETMRLIRKAQVAVERTLLRTLSQWFGPNDEVPEAFLNRLVRANPTAR